MREEVKISGLTPATSLIGLWTIGVDANNNSVKVNLSWLKESADNLTVIKTNAEKATAAANKAVDDANKQMFQISQDVNLAISGANTAKTNANTAATNANNKATEANAAASAANTAKQAADTAASLANTATTNANKAKDAANTAAGNANTAATSANTAKQAADTAASLANTAATNANTKAGLADSAATKANAESGKATTAANLANDKASKAETAANNANTAAGRVETAITNAETAANAANTAAGSVNDAKTAATNAAAAANTASGLAISAASGANTAKDAANTATILANAATTNANTAKDAANTAASNANTKATAANTAATAANAAATNANTKAGLADTAATNANKKAELADAAATNANTEAGKATSAAGLANTKAGLANTAAERANTAATAAENVVSGIRPDWNETNTSSSNFIANKPVLKTVATSGNYNDLLNKPTIPAAYTHPTTSGNKHIPAGGAAGQFLKWSADGTAIWGSDNNTTYALATVSANGLMAASDKSKLDGIEEGANEYTHPKWPNHNYGLYNIEVDLQGHVVIAEAATKADITRLGIPAQDTVYTHPTGAGNNHIPAGGEAGQFLKWSAAGVAVWSADNNTTYGVATQSANGLMSAADKKRLDFEYGGNNVNTLANLPVNKRTVNAVLISTSPLSLAGALEEGQEMQIMCTPKSSFVLPIPNGGIWTSMSGTSFSVTNKIFEISIWCHSLGFYSIAIKEQD